MTFASNAAAPIGVFDSGLGGLTVARCVWSVLPQERLLYVADQAHVPYGGRDLGEVCGFACGISDALLKAGCKALVMACNISSATALRVVQAENPEIPILGVILPGAQAAAAQTRSQSIGVLATEGTVRSGAYTNALRALEPKLRVIEVACPEFVPLVESGAVASPKAFTAARAYLAPLRAADVDIVILGCTHYPFLLPTLQTIAPELRFIDPAEQTARELADRLTQMQRTAPSQSAPRPVLATTGNRATFADQIRRFLPEAAASAEIVEARWQEGMLRFS